LQACWQNVVVGEIAERNAHSGASFGTFAAKNRVAYFARIIGPRTHGDLEMIREIRNQFAHSLTMDRTGKRLEVVAFDHPNISSRCDRLLAGKHLELEWSDGRRLQPSTSRNLFILTAAELGAQLHGAATLVKEGMAPAELQKCIVGQ
jgi:hypothetical protein